MAVVLTLLSLPLGLLYVGRPHRAGLYLLLALLCLVVVVLLAHNGLWPAGVTWELLAYVVVVVAVVDAYRIAKQHATVFEGPWFTTWWGLLAVQVALLAFVIGFRVIAYEPFRSPSSSMLPTLHADDEFVVSKLAFRESPPQRGDLVVHRGPEGDVRYVKRVIGLPGEVIVYDADDKSLTINGVAADLDVVARGYGDLPNAEVVREVLGDRSHLQLHIPGFRSAGGTFAVPAEHYFVLGDNRDSSVDSRYSDFSFVPRDAIVGKATFVWWNVREPARAGTWLE